MRWMEWFTAVVGEVSASVEDRATEAYHVWEAYGSSRGADDDVRHRLFCRYEALSAASRERLR